MKTNINRAAAQKKIDSMKEEIKSLEDIINVKRGDIKEWLNTLQDAFDDQGVDSVKFYKKCHDAGLTADEIGYRELKIVVAAANGDWVPNYNDSKYKYEPRWDMRTGSGFGFSGTTYVNWVTTAGAGSRLCFKDYDTMYHVCTQPEFVTSYKKYLCK